MLKESLAYSVGELVFRGSRFFLLPVYIALLPTAEYGVLQQVLIATSFVEVFLALAIKQVMLRLFYDHESGYSRRVFLGTLLLYLLGGHLVGYVFLVHTPLPKLLFDFDITPAEYAIIVLFSFSSEILQLALNYLRIERLLRVFLQGCLVVSLLDLALISGLLWLGSRDAMVRIYGGLPPMVIGIAYCVTTVPSLRVTFARSRGAFSVHWRYAWPLIGMNVMGWFIASFDRILLSDLWGTASLAVYGLADQIASMYKLAQMGFVRALSVSLFEKVDGDQYGSFASSAGIAAAAVYASVGVLGVTAAYFAGPLVLPADYAGALPAIFLLLLSKFFLMCTVYDTLLLQAEKRTRPVLGLYLLSTAAFFPFCMWLIPNYGVLGAAGANVASTAIVVIASQAYLRLTALAKSSIRQHVPGALMFSVVLSALTLGPILFAVAALVVGTLCLHILHKNRYRFL